ncbi:TonB-dependent receptor [Halioxenophilus sp. WMMB6]|uniref:TonB-dependent receptor n=1 Tax=Halioxenophilus sp. WMMB6 TaxID=3073815 RepID=UPI00295EB15D|nr:TonB-dependent receptor [Halioxenophilus sp. WMMB6]
MTITINLFTSRSLNIALVALPITLSMVMHSAMTRASVANENILEEVEVVGSSPLTVGNSDGREPFHVQIFSADDMQQANGYSVASLLEQQAASITVNDAQNSLLQPDVRFRGYTASPLLGSSQGVAVYFNGVRINETFGDTVNWDLLPQSVIERMGLVAGANPVYGQNALGGALIMEGKNGFTSEPGSVAVTTGDFGREQISASRAFKREDWGLLLAAEKLREEGWRDYSATDANHLYSALSWQGNRASHELTWLWASTRMNGNGAAPEALLAKERSAVFTHPDQTQNRLNMVILSSRYTFAETGRFSSSLFYRRLSTDTFNGDGSDSERCDDGLWLCDDGELLTDERGVPVAESFNAINNLSQRQQQSWGLALVASNSYPLLAVNHDITVGADYYAGRAQFRSQVEYATLTEDRATTHSGRFNPEAATLLDTSQNMFSLYASDAIAVTEATQLLLSLRYNRVKIGGDDRSGERPELTANHYYHRINGGVGLSHQWRQTVAFYGGVYQSSRTPSPIELACSHEQAPCNLPNTFLADPPLDDIVARNIELGARGDSEQNQWQLGLFHTRNHNDIHFQTTGGVSSNEGFFRNIGDTVFQGLEASFSRHYSNWFWQVNYTALAATYADAFYAYSPNHPDFDGDALLVERGNYLPGIARHTLKLLVDYQWSEQWQWGLAVNAGSGVYLRGDEANLDHRTHGYWLANAWLNWQPRPALAVRLEVNNLFNREYQRFGLYGEVDEVMPELDDSPRFLSPANPRAAFLTLRYQWQ